VFFCWVCRQRHVLLRACRRSSAAGNSSTNSLNFSRLQEGKACCATWLSTLGSVGLRWNNNAAVPEMYCGATAAQPQKQQGKSLKPGLPDIRELSPQLQQEWQQVQAGACMCLTSHSDGGNIACCLLGKLSRKFIHGPFATPLP